MLGAASAAAMQLSGTLLQAADFNGQPVGIAWHSSSDPAARPLGFSGFAPPTLRNWPLANDDQGELNVPLLPGVHVVTLVWQCASDEFPPMMVLNLYFNGDNLTPGISAIVSSARGLTQFHANTNSNTVSLYLRAVDNPATLFFDDGTLRAQLDSAFYMSSGGETDQWRPTDFFNIDRVGTRDFRPDGQPDEILVFELTVGASNALNQPASLAPAPKHDMTDQNDVPSVSVSPDHWGISGPTRQNSAPAAGREEEATAADVSATPHTTIAPAARSAAPTTVRTALKTISATPAYVTPSPPPAMSAAVQTSTPAPPSATPGSG